MIRSQAFRPVGQALCRQDGRELPSKCFLRVFSEVALRLPSRRLLEVRFSTAGSEGGSNLRRERMTRQLNEQLSNEEQLEQREKLALDLLSFWNYRYAVKQRLVRGRTHPIPHHIDDRCPAGMVGVIGK